MFLAVVVVISSLSLDSVDVDGQGVHNVDGQGSGGFGQGVHVVVSGKQSASQWIISTAPNAEQLDREQQPFIGLVLRCVDFPGQNIEEIVILIELVDQNDNRPVINWAHQGEQYLVLPSREWPRGGAITRFWAHDRDVGENARITFQLDSEQSGNDFFQIDSKTGLLTASDIRPLSELYEMLGGEMFELKVLATDNGHPPLSSIAKVNIIFTDEASENIKELKMVWPSVEDNPLELKEDIPVGRRIGQAEAIFIGKKSKLMEKEENEIFYKIGSNLDGNWTENEEKEQMLRIDEKTGEIFILKQFDYESQEQWAVSLKNVLNE
uniref:Cadherin domain-containing protein n=1 Tax=Meloidogyne javanica TaxID=6303 RepID=A0A915M7R6_MELJA